MLVVTNIPNVDTTVYVNLTCLLDESGVATACGLCSATDGGCACITQCVLHGAMCLFIGVGGVPLVSGAMRDVRDKLAAHVNMSDPTPVSSTPPHSAENEDGHAMDSTSREHVTHDPTKPTNDSNTAAAGDASDDMSGEKPARREDPDPPPTAPAMEGVGNSDGTTTDDESTAATPSPRDGGGSGGGGGKASTQLVLPEDRVLGIVTWATYKHYIQHAGYVRIL